MAYLQLIALSLVLVLVFAGVAHVSELVELCDRVLPRLRRRPIIAPLPLRARPIEQVAADVRRLGRRFHQDTGDRSWARSEGLRRAYDHALGEGCAALGHSHLLGVLPPGAELDAERARVEAELWRAGLGRDDWLNGAA